MDRIQWYLIYCFRKIENEIRMLIYINMKANFISIVFQKTRHSEAESWFLKAKEMVPEDPSVHLHYGLFLMDSDRNLEAAEEFARAVSLKSDDYESVFNAGVAYRQANMNTEAEKFYRMAVQLRPNVST